MLGYAASWRNVSGIIMLLEKGAHRKGIGPADSIDSPLMRAVRVGCVKTSKVLIAYGANVDRNTLKLAFRDARQFVARVLLQKRMRLFRAIVRYIIVSVRYREHFYRNRDASEGAKSLMENQQIQANPGKVNERLATKHNSKELM